MNKKLENIFYRLKRAHDELTDEFDTGVLIVSMWVTIIFIIALGLFHLSVMIFGSGGPMFFAPGIIGFIILLNKFRKIP